MRELVESLLLLQELEIVLQESRIVHGDAALSATAPIHEQIVRVRESLPSHDLKRFDALRRTGAGVVRETGGVCSGCHLNVPKGDLNRMLRGEVEWVCPNCGRYLLLAG